MSGPARGAASRKSGWTAARHRRGSVRRRRVSSATVSALAQPQRLFQHRIEHRREVAGRGIDDLQHLGGRGLLLQRLARLGDEPRVLHRDDRLRREILQQRDLLIGERPHLVAMDRDDAEQPLVPAERKRQIASSTADAR